MVPEVKRELILFVVTNPSREDEADPAAPTGPHHLLTVFHHFLQNQSACFGYLAFFYVVIPSFQAGFTAGIHLQEQHELDTPEQP